MASNVVKKRLLVLGGNGYVGQNVCDAAIRSGGFEAVRSIARSGAPSAASVPDHLKKGMSEVEWTSGDVFDKSARDEAMTDVDAVVSCIGAFGSNEFMKRVCGGATIEAIRAARERGVSLFGFVSSAQVYEGSAGLRLPASAPMHGYFQGKYEAEQELLRSFPQGHVILRPGFVFGPRSVGGHTLPLQLVGRPISFVGTQMGPISSLIQSIPFVGKECSSMVPVECVGRAMIQSLTDLEAEKKGLILDAEEIRKF
ncbi:hypothetical protein ACHAWF_002469 [Thalassiosira exigua]